MKTKTINLYTIKELSKEDKKRAEGLTVALNDELRKRREKEIEEAKKIREQKDKDQKEAMQLQIGLSEFHSLQVEQRKKNEEQALQLAAEAYKKFAEKISDVTKYISMAMQQVSTVVSGIGQTMQMFSDNELQNIKNKHGAIQEQMQMSADSRIAQVEMSSEQELAALQAQLDAGIISQEEYSTKE